MLNAFNSPWFTPVTGKTDNNPLFNTLSEFNVTDAESGRTVQLVWRLNW